MPAELRKWKDTDAFQRRFRIRKELADLRYVTPARTAAMLPPDVIEDIEDDLFGGKRRTWAQIEKRLCKSVGFEASLNFEGFAKKRKKGLFPRPLVEDDEDAVSSDTGNALVIASLAGQGLKCP
ncbi:MAG: hypothetical protein ISN28_15535 [Ectothiorhodospiraceae bacterium AqS1]|nr:hypothetical protein [Ectothiorhodospiraceae bacterium AqS1]MBF2761644.1 hypothetical protein [Ectothiorhodospiraceae bacterium AqS1]